MRAKALLRSLLVTSLLSFVVPLLLIGFAVVILAIVALIPGVAPTTQAMINQVMSFLRVFGSGDAIGGATVIASACSLVATLFDAYNFYYSSLRNG